jgi:hypothetical protein
LEKKNPFKVPDYYFQSLPDKVVANVKGAAQSAPWIARLENRLNHAFALLFRPRYAIPVSALLLLLIVGVNFFNSKVEAPPGAAPLSEISSEEMREFLIENADDNDLIALGTPGEKLNGFIPDEISSEELEDYLNNSSDNQMLEEEIL